MPSVQPAPPSPEVRTWRVSTAVRIFGLALAAGQSLSAGALEAATAILLALALIALVSVTVESGLNGRRSPWVPVVEGILAAMLLTTSLPVAALLVYLAVPPVVAGLRHGWVTTANTALATLGAIAVSSLGYEDFGVDTEHLTSSGWWIVVGLGAGLLAAWQSRSMRRLEASHAPYMAARRLLGQLQALTKQGGVGLDSGTLAESLAERLRDLADASAVAVFIRSGAGPMRTLGSVGFDDELSELADACVRSGTSIIDDKRAALVLRVDEGIFGAAVLARDTPLTSDALRDLQFHADAESLPLETALLFDEIHLAATSEERSRLARDMHDGVAQEVVALGFLVDEIEAESSNADSLPSLGVLRNEISRVVAELRLSIFDLRHEVSDHNNLSRALSEYVHEVSARSDMRVHLNVNQHGASLPRRTESELLRIAQEAINNVRKHAAAINMWVSLSTDGEHVSLVVEDDGVGSALPKDRHYGMHTMRERAQKIGAELRVAQRQDGGTVVSLHSTPNACSGGHLSHDYSSPAGR